MKFKLTLIMLLFLVSFSFSQKLYFEVIESSSSTYGTIGSYNRLTDITAVEEDISNVFAKSEGWEMLGIDNNIYYYQITDTTSNNYGQINTWDGANRVNYGSINDIFTTPKIWTLSGVDNSVLYFQVKDQTNSQYGQIDMWDGFTRINYGGLKDIVAFPKYWTMTGVDEGFVYIQWINDDDNYGLLNSWDGTTRATNERLSNIYDDFKNWTMAGITTPIASTSEFINSIKKIKNHISGGTQLSASELKDENTIINENIKALENDVASIEIAFELVELYENTNGALFTTSTTSSGFSRTALGMDLEFVLLAVQQGIIDYSYTTSNIDSYPELFENKLFKTSSYFPGAVAPPANATASRDISIKATQTPSWGSLDIYETMPARRPTGCYLAPGSVATITVPPQLIGKGYSVRVGAQSWDLKKKSTIKRMDRVSLVYPIDAVSIKVANPLGGGIYIEVPYKADDGIITINIANAVRSPFFSATSHNKTTLSEWQQTERLNPGPWTDFETDKFMMQVPTSWIYAYDDPITLMADWDESMDAISELLGRQLVRAKTALYLQVDVILRGDANYPGYPQSNTPYNPNSNYDGNYQHWILKGPQFADDIVFHEMGHAHAFTKFPGESEAAVNFLYIAVQNKKFGMDLDTAFMKSFGRSLNVQLDDAAEMWMVTENFRNGNPMNISNVAGDEMKYQHRGYGKYVEIVNLFGWDPLDDFWYSVSEDFEKGITYPINSDPIDSRMLRMSRAAKLDLRPLIHFWGTHPENFDELEKSIKEEELAPSALIYDRLQYYKTIIPMDNDEFQAHAYERYPNGIGVGASPLYGEGWYYTWLLQYNEIHGSAAQVALQDIIDLYFPDGRPVEDETGVIKDQNQINGPKLDLNNASYIEIYKLNGEVVYSGVNHVDAIDSAKDNLSIRDVLIVRLLDANKQFLGLYLEMNK